MKKRMKKAGGLRLSVGIAALCLAAGAVPAAAGAKYLPDVTEEMTDPLYWTADRTDGDAVLADLDKIQEINLDIVEGEGTNVADLSEVNRVFDGAAFNKSLWKSGMSDAAYFLGSELYDGSGNEITGEFLAGILENIGSEHSDKEEYSRLGICVNATDVLSLPTFEILTDAKDNPDDNEFQLSSLRVNEPVLVKAVSADGQFYYCGTSCVSGWVPSADIAICKNRAEWMDAWAIPDEEAIVVTDGKIFLEETNQDFRLSGKLLTMGTILRKVADAELEKVVSNRSVFQNYVVWIPARTADGSYERLQALISQNKGVNEGFLPLTLNNILKTAFSMLGDRYGWGGMLHASDCSSYVRNVYKCFGLELARNTTWQANMPVFKFDVTNASDEDKKAVLDTLDPGAILEFSGHEMLYLGERDGKYYVVSNTGSMRDFEKDSVLSIGSVVINTLDVHRMNGKTWLQSLEFMIVPYEKGLPEGAIVVTAEEAEDEAVVLPVPEEELVPEEESAPGEEAGTAADDAAETDPDGGEEADQDEGEEADQEDTDAAEAGRLKRQLPHILISVG